MKSLMSLWSCTANELAVRCCTSATRDIKTVVCRTEHEGLSFLAITLADYGKAIQKWLDHGRVAPSDVPAFKRDRLTGFPLFLGGFLERVFCPSSGLLLSNPDIEAIYALRQLTLGISKIALPAPPSDRKGRGTLNRKVVSAVRERRAMSDFVQCEQDVKASDNLLTQQEIADFKRISDLLFSDLFDQVDSSILWGNNLGKHGPGAVADRLSSNAKWNLRTWTRRLQSVLPAEDHLVPNSSFVEEMERDLTILEPGAEMPVRVITVPKTLKSPRIIAIEPTAMQFAQQLVLRNIREALREDYYLSRFIGLDDQDPNRSMARYGSLSGELATLDLSEASDRVSNQHVRAMFDGWPHLSEAVQASRSRKADVPGHGVLRLAKFASMGSALCFPVEAMVFLTVIFLGIERESSRPLSRKAIHRYRERVRVFGDDIIVPTDHVQSVVDALSDFGHKVNINKSFWTGKFRESCGREYYDGHDVSIVKVRELLPSRRQNTSGVVAAVSLRNQLYWAGLWKSAAFMDDYLRKVLNGHFPNVSPTAPLLGRESVLGYGNEFERFHPSHQSPLVKGFYTVAKPPRDHLEGGGALLKCLSTKPWVPEDSILRERPAGEDFDVANVDNEHLERSGRPEYVSIKLGWRSPF